MEGIFDSNGKGYSIIIPFKNKEDAKGADKKVPYATMIVKGVPKPT